MGLGNFICCNLSRIVGPYDQTFIETTLGKGTTFSIRLIKAKQEKPVAEPVTELQA
jgi:hypothetical protein